MNRPTLDKNISLLDFKEFYWLKEELVNFCKQVGIKTTGSKIELTEKIEKYLLTGKVVSFSQKTNSKQSNFDWNNEKLTRQTIITDNYKNSENVRSFFIKEIGETFSFNVLFMSWLKENVGKTLNDAIIKWKEIKALKKDKNFKSEIDPQFEYNRYMRAFLADNPYLSSKEAMRYWMLKRTRRGTNEYEPKDLELS